MENMTMELEDFKNAIRAVDEEQLKHAAAYADEHYDELVDDFKAKLKNAASAGAPADSAEQVELDFAIMMLCAKREKGLFPDFYRLMRNKSLRDIYTEQSWLMRSLHRIISSFCEADDLGAIGDLVLDASLFSPVREQALLSLHFIWLEKIAPEKDIIDEFRRLLEQGLSPEDDWKLWMALVINASVIGGLRLKPEVMRILDDGRFADQTSFARKIVNGLFSNGNSQFRNMMKNEHKGFFTKLDEEVADYTTPPKEENIEMPQKGKPLVREQPKIGRNDPCPCGSGKKYKKCCGRGNAEL